MIHVAYSEIAAASQPHPYLVGAEAGRRAALVGAVELLAINKLPAVVHGAGVGLAGLAPVRGAAREDLVLKATGPGHHPISLGVLREELLILLHPGRVAQRARQQCGKSRDDCANKQKTTHFFLHRDSMHRCHCSAHHRCGAFSYIL